ncbi:hypothetical protein [Klebsiella variicola]|uniref:hypothetical protein n=1 Tax=Klebsiella variicola TaxID=244366 RepID=UPI00115C074C|nr:hypothetical protein [Klebsiella variicola]MCS4335322.1 hypothetical protein [Klebsiella variicola subsp. variicola]
MSSCMAVVLNGNTEVKYFPFHDCASAEVATDMADEWRYAAIEAIGWDEAHRFHLRAVRPVVVFRTVNGSIVECDPFDVDIDPAVSADRDYHLCAFGFDRERRYSGYWDLDGAEIIEYIA